MSETVIVAILSLVGTCIGSIVAILTANNLTKYKIEELTKEVEKHNSVIERTFVIEKRLDDIEALFDDKSPLDNAVVIEKRLDVIDEKILVANHRLKDLEESHNEHCPKCH